MRSFFCRAQKGCALNTRGSTQLVASILIRDGWTGLDKTTTGLAVYRAPAEPEFGRGKTIQSWYCYFHAYTLTFFCTSWLHENSWKTMQEWHISCLAGKTGSLLISYYHQTCFRRKETCSSEPATEYTHFLTSISDYSTCSSWEKTISNIPISEQLFWSVFEILAEDVSLEHWKLPWVQVSVFFVLCLDACVSLVVWPLCTS